MHSVVLGDRHVNRCGIISTWADPSLHLKNKEDKYTLPHQGANQQSRCWGWPDILRPRQRSGQAFPFL